MRARISIERQVLARLLSAQDPATLRRWLLGLRLLGIGERYFVAEHRSAFLAIVALADHGALATVEAVVRQADGRVDGGYVAWVATAYQGETGLRVLADALVDARRRGTVDSVGRVLINAAADPAADIGRAIAVACAALRRVRSAAA